MNRGFTLIELLVVISIISLLSSVILSNLNSARLKGRDAAIKAAALQYRILLEQEYLDTGSYAALQVGWNEDDLSCSDYYNSSTYISQARKICENIVSNSAAHGTGVVSDLWRFHSGNNVDNGSKYSIMAWLPGKKAWFCVGSSGVSDVLGTSGHMNYWSEPGCWSTP